LPRLAILAGLGLALGVLALAAGTGLRSGPRRSALELGALTRTAAFVDGTLRSTKRLADLRQSSWGGPITAADGESVTIFLSDSYPVDPAKQQAAADFLTQLYHGSELSSVTVYLAPLAEVESVCSPGAVGCYRRGEIVATGDPLPDGTSAVNVLAHEYGHHVADNRNNAPWDAVRWGPKRWATAAHVCTRTAAGTVYPGDEADHYKLNPGEGWAETYRLLNYQKQTWPDWIPGAWKIVDQSFYPTAAEIDAARDDVLEPWQRRDPVPWNGRLRKVAPRRKPLRVPSVKHTITTPLDGDVALIVPRAPLGMRLSAFTVRGKFLGETDRRILPIRICGQRRIVLMVSSKRPGRFRVSYSVP
jgi:hypothetical protein